MLKTRTISLLFLNAMEGKLTFVLNIIIINIIIILASASTLSAGYWFENEIYGFARGNSEPVVKKMYSEQNVLSNAAAFHLCKDIIIIFYLFFIFFLAPASTKPAG